MYMCAHQTFRRFACLAAAIVCASLKFTVVVHAFCVACCSVSSQPWCAAQLAFSVRPNGCLCLIMDWQSASASRMLDVGCLLVMTCALTACAVHTESSNTLPVFGLPGGIYILSLPVNSWSARMAARATRLLPACTPHLRTDVQCRVSASLF